MDHRVQSLIIFMQSDLRRELTLNEMAHHVNLTPEHLCRIFKGEMGSSPAKYLKWLRMQKAQKLLETTHLSVKEIMIIVGVKDKSHFVRDFELACGLTPTKYRALHISIRFERTLPVERDIKIG